MHDYTYIKHFCFQRKKEQGSTSLTNGHDGSGDHRESKKKKKKDKPNTMSLEQFNKQLEDKKTHSDGRFGTVCRICPD